MRTALRQGFTMVEILAVIAVIAILMSVAAVGIQKMDQGQATSTALSVSEAIFDEARSAAVGRGARARVLIHNDPAEDQRARYLRYLAVAVEVEGSWEIISRGTTLPSGVFFDVVGVQTATSSVPDIGTYGEMTIALPGDKASPKACYYYEFNAEGLCVDSGNDASLPGAAFVVAGGVMPPSAVEPKVQGNNRAGFVVWRSGRSSLFRNPEHITPSN
ncbi:MAG: type II secretion system protein [Verrucomicrobia bacterium]|nr:type II secretion system protein [Verrucomicrobiota bacterium]MDA1005694.1 type II secretion system protein [Verrucomicrobiota bacterium]